MSTAAALRYACQPLEAFATAAFQAAGMRPGDASLAAHSLVAADLRGVMSHGLVRLPVYVHNLRSSAVNPTAQPTVTAETDTTAVVDGQNAMGQVVGTRAMALAIQKAAERGVGVVAARHSNHLGTCAHYALLAAQRGMVGIAMTNGAAAMAAWGGVDRIVGNNPIAIAAPTDGHCPVVLDMAQTVVARGKIKLAELRGERIPLGWAADPAGRPTEDPSAALSGALLPIGGHKGYGLAVVVDLLAAALSGARLSPEIENMGFTEADERPVFGPEPPGVGTGHWFMALDVARFVPLDEFRRRATGYAHILKASRRAEGVATISLPGEPECRAEQERQARGIPYEAHVVEQLRALAVRAGLPFPHPLTG